MSRPATPSIEKRAKLLLELNGPTLNRKLIYFSDEQMWGVRFDRAGADNYKQRDLFSYIFRNPAFILDPTIILREHDTVNRLDDERLKEWMDGVRECVKDKDWADLFVMTHRM